METFTKFSNYLVVIKMNVQLNYTHLLTVNHLFSLLSAADFVH